MKNKQDRNTESTKCELPRTKSISEKVHEHLKNKNDHISNADIRNAAINPNENELETKNKNDDLNEKNTEDKIITPWDVVDKNAVE